MMMFKEGSVKGVAQWSLPLLKGASDHGIFSIILLLDGHRFHDF